MRYFYLLELWHLLEEYRLKNGQKLANFLKNLINIFFVKFQNFWLKKNCGLFALAMMMFLCLVWRSFAIDLQANFLKLNYINDPELLFSPLLFALDFLVHIAEITGINHVLLAEIVFNAMGIFLAIFCSLNLNKSLISADLITKNVLLFSFIFSYFFGLSFKIFSFEISLLKLLVIAYISLSLRENVKSNFFINLLAIACGILLVLSKWQLIILVFAFEFMQFFSFKKELIKYHDDHSLLSYLKLRYTLNLIARTLLTSSIIVILMLNKKLLGLGDIFDQIKQFDYENYRFFSSQIINKLFQESNSFGFFAILSRDILLFFLVLIISQFKTVNDSSSFESAILNKFFTIFFIASFAIILLMGYDNKILKLLFFNINIPLIFIVFVRSLIAEKFNFKKHLIVLLIFVALALGDYYIFYEIIFYLPSLWFIIHLIFLKKINKKITHIDYFKDLNFVDRWLFLRDLRSKIIFIFFIIFLIYLAFSIDFFIACFVNIIIFCYLLVFFEKINYKILKNKQYHFFISVTIILAITYLIILSFKGFDLVGQRPNSFFGYQRSFLNNFISDKISKLLKPEDGIVIIDDQNAIDLNFLVLKNKLFTKNIVTLNTFSDNEEFSKLTNKKIKFFLINNSFIFNNKSCLISKYEQLMKIEMFKDFYLKNFKKHGRYLISQSWKKNYSFYNHKIDNLNDNLNFEENFLIYDIIVLYRK